MATATKKSPAKAAAAVKAAAANPELVLLTAIEPIRHDGDDVSPGNTFAATPDVAETLLASGAASIADVE